MYEDEISRVAFADPDMARHLLALLPEDAVAGLDPRRLRRLPAEHVGRGARRRVADMAWAVGAPTPKRPDAEALLVVEFQSAPHVRMALRMEAYAALLRLEMAADLPAGLMRWQPDLEMLTLDAGTLGAEDGDVNPAAALLRPQRCRRPAELPGLAAALFGALRRDGRSDLAERLSDALLRMLAARFGGDERGAGHTEELRRALRHMEEPRMLAETVAQWRGEALDEGRRLGMSEGMLERERALLRRQAARRFGVATGDALALLANEEDIERLAEMGDPVVGCANGEELLRRGRDLLNGASAQSCKAHKKKGR